MKYIDNDKKEWKEVFTVPNYPYSFTGLIALPSPIINGTYDLLILGGIKLQKENQKWVFSSQFIHVSSDGENFDLDNLMTTEDGKESPDFFFDNQSIQVTETIDDKEMSATYCLGRSIYRITRDG